VAWTVGGFCLQAIRREVDTRQLTSQPCADELTEPLVRRNKGFLVFETFILLLHESLIFSEGHYRLKI
jgi:hypothetical protein